MIEDTGTTPRRSFTPRQRLKLFEAHKGRCVICGRNIDAGDRWIVEHIRPLGLGGSNDDDNLGPVHEACAHAKTHGATGDAAQIARAKRIKMRHIGIRAARSTIQSRGFPKVEREPKKTTKVVARREMFEDAP